MNKLLISLLVIGIFLLYYCMLLRVVTPIVRYSVDNSSFFLFNLLCCLSSLVVLYFVHGKKSFLKTLGLEKNLGKGLLLGFVSTLPLFIYSIVYGTWNIELTCWRLVNATLFAGFFEEFFFRGILFGQLFRYAKWGFIPAGLLTGIIFGFGHIFQGNDVLQVVMVVTVTGLGSLFFSWIYMEFGQNLWASISLHVLMNFAWTAFSISDNGAIGSYEVNIVRILVIFIAVFGVIFYKRRNHIPFQVTYRTLWVNH